MEEKRQVYLPPNSIKLTGIPEVIKEPIISSLFKSFSLPPTYTKVYTFKDMTSSFAILSFQSGDEAFLAKKILNDREVTFSGEDFDEIEATLFVSVYEHTVDPIFQLSPEMLAHLPVGSFRGRIIVVESMRYMDFAVSQLLYGQSVEYYDPKCQGREIILGMDTEWRPSIQNKQYNPTCLLQLATQHVAVLFRLNHLKEEFFRQRGRQPSPAYRLPPQLQKILQNPKIHKVGLGLHADIRRLADDYDGICVNSAHDIKEIPLWSRVRPQGLQGIVALFMGLKMDKKSRISNWEKPRLSRNQVVYAATDAWASLEVYLKMINIPYSFSFPRYENF